MITPPIELAAQATGSELFERPRGHLAKESSLVGLQRGQQAAELEATTTTSSTSKPSMSARNRPQAATMPRLLEKSVIIHKDENGFGLRIKGQAPVYIEHVHEGGAAWRAGVRALDSICKVNGVPVNQMDHKDVVLMFKSCSRFVALTLISHEHLLALSNHGIGASHEVQFTIGSQQSLAGPSGEQAAANLMISNLISAHHSRQYSIYSRHSGEEARGGRARLNCAIYSSATGANDTTSLFAPSDFALLDTSPSFLMDRTRSCRFNATTSLHPNSQLEAAAAQTRAHQKMHRRDSSEDQATGAAASAGGAAGDKRVATCACCQLQQCRARQAGDAQPTHKHLIQRPLSLREPLTKQNDMARDAQQQQQPQATASQQLPIDKTGAMRSLINRIPQSVSSSSLAKGKRATRGGAGAGQAQLGANQTASGAQQAQVAPAKPRVVNKRIEIIRELIDTERTHTERLRCLDELFYRPLKQAGFMTGEQLRQVFSCHRTLYKIHRQIYRILLSANFDICSQPLVGSALLEIFEGDLKRRLERASCAFCSAQATNIELLNKLTRRDTKAGEFLAQITSQRMIGRLGVKDLLASCFQRLTKYPLLLENLLKATPQMSPDDVDDDRDHDDHDFEGAAAAADFDCLASGAPTEAGGSFAANGAEFVGGQEREEFEDEDEEEDDDDEDEEDEDDEEARRLRREAAEEARRNSRRMLAISLAEEREFIERALVQSRQILVRVNDSIRISMSRNKLKEIWKRTDKHPGVPLIDITKQQVVHEGLLTLRLSRRSFDVYVLLLNDYIIILTRDGQDKYRLKFFTPEGKSGSGSGGGGGGGGSGSVASGGGPSATIGGAGQSANTQAQGSFGNNSASGQFGNNSSSSTTTTSLASGGSNLIPQQTVYSPVFVIDEHLTTRDAATDENGFYLLCKRKDDSRIYEFASRSPAERMKWRDKIQWTIERQMSKNARRPSGGSTLTKSSSEISANGLANSEGQTSGAGKQQQQRTAGGQHNHEQDLKRGAAAAAAAAAAPNQAAAAGADEPLTPAHHSRSSSRTGGEPTKIVGTISYVIDDGIVMPNKMESSRVFVDQAIQVNILDGSKVSAARGHESGDGGAGGARAGGESPPNAER